MISKISVTKIILKGLVWCKNCVKIAKTKFSQTFPLRNHRCLQRCDNTFTDTNSHCPNRRLCSTTKSRNECKESCRLQYCVFSAEFCWNGCWRMDRRTWGRYPVDIRFHGRNIPVYQSCRSGKYAQRLQCWALVEPEASSKRPNGSVWRDVSMHL